MKMDANGDRGIDVSDCRWTSQFRQIVPEFGTFAARIVEPTGGVRGFRRVHDYFICHRIAE